jgi:cell division transport system permease protein
MRLLRALGYGLGRSLRGLARRPGLAACTVGAVAAALLVVGLAGLVARNVGALAGSWRGDAHMIVYLAEGTGDAGAERIATALRSIGGIERVDYVPAAEAYQRLRAALGDHGELLDDVDPSVVPASLEIVLAAGIRDVAAVHPITERLRATPGIEEVELVGQWVDQVSGLLGALRRGAWALALVAGIACLVVVAAAVRLRTQAVRDEARAAALVGASPHFIRGPLLVEGMLQGAAGAALALLALWLIHRSGAPAIEAALAQSIGAAPIRFLPADELAALVGVGAGLGLLGGWLGTGRRALA